VNDEDVQAQHREVQRLLGRCLLRLQQYERLMKAIVANHDLSGPAHKLESIRAARIDDASRKTLGNLVGQLFGSYFVTEGANTAAGTLVDQRHRPGRHSELASNRHRPRLARGGERARRGRLDARCRGWAMDHGAESRTAAQQVRMRQLATGAA
jgi:hypothetical protein